MAVARLADHRLLLAGPLRRVEALAGALVERGSRAERVGHLRRGHAHLLHANRLALEERVVTLVERFDIEPFPDFSAK